MKQLSNFGETRTTGSFCVYCGRPAGTRDHAPSRVFLDLGGAIDLPVVKACLTCNNGFSRDELYVACLIECTLAGSAEPEAMKRPKIKRILRETVSLASSLAKARQHKGGSTYFDVDTGRVRSIVLKLARGHAAFELNEPQLEEPAYLGFAPLITLDENARLQFETPPNSPYWPEVGSRAFQR